jgi:RimJ/RimL family protein N-acetyltransferase
VITLREVNEADLDALYEIQSDPAALAMAVFGPSDREMHSRYWRALRSDPDGVARAIEVDGVLCGSVMSYRRDGRRYVAYSIARDLWGRGIGTEALRLLLADVNERPIYAWVVLSNAGSIRVLEKNGFTQADPQPPPNQTKVPERLYVLS